MSCNCLFSCRLNASFYLMKSCFSFSSHSRYCFKERASDSTRPRRMSKSSMGLAFGAVDSFSRSCTTSSSASAVVAAVFFDIDSPVMVSPIPSRPVPLPTPEPASPPALAESAAESRPHIHHKSIMDSGSSESGVPDRPSCFRMSQLSWSSAFTGCGESLFYSVGDTFRFGRCSSISHRWRHALIHCVVPAERSHDLSSDLC